MSRLVLLVDSIISCYFLLFSRSSKEMSFARRFMFETSSCFMFDELFWIVILYLDHKMHLIAVSCTNNYLRKTVRSEKQSDSEEVDCLNWEVLRKYVCILSFCTFTACFIWWWLVMMCMQAGIFWSVGRAGYCATTDTTAYQTQSTATAWQTATTRLTKFSAPFIMCLQNWRSKVTWIT